MIPALPDILIGRVRVTDGGIVLKEPATDEELEALDVFKRDMEELKRDSLIVNIEE